MCCICNQNVIPYCSQVCISILRLICAWCYKDNTIDYTDDFTVATGQTNQFNSANIDKWREVFAGKMLEQSQVEYQQPIGEGKPARFGMLTLIICVVVVCFMQRYVRKPIVT